MVKDPSTQKSEVSQGDKPREKTAEEATEKSPEELLSSLTGEPMPLRKSEPAGEEEESEEPTNSEDEDPIEEEEETDEDLEPGDSPTIEEESLETLLSEDDSIPEKVSIKKTPYFNDFKKEDVTVEDGAFVVNSKFLFDDVNNIFGLDGKGGNLSLFLKKNNQANTKNKRLYMDQLAEIGGFDSRHSFCAAIERYTRAKDDNGRSEVLQEQFPEWSWNADFNPEELPILKGTFSDDVKGSKEESVIKRKLPWASEEINRAVNGYVADNDNVTKESIIKSAKLASLLKDYSSLSRNGKPLTATEALKMAIPQADIELSGEKAPKSAGGSKVRQNRKKTAESSDGMKALLKVAGVDTKDFEKFESSKN